MKKKKISGKNQKKLDLAKQNGIDLSGIILNYGLRFTMKLLKSVTKKKKSRSDVTFLIRPKVRLSQILDFDPDLYVQRIRETGLIVRKAPEFFQDDDTGKKLRIPEWEVNFI
jgi:hypothetical protein